MYEWDVCMLTSGGRGNVQLGRQRLALLLRPAADRRPAPNLLVLQAVSGMCACSIKG